MAKTKRGLEQLDRVSGMDLTGRSPKEAMDLYWDRKISWVELAALLDTTQENFLAGRSGSKQVVLKQILAAYRLLKTQKPDYLTDLAKVKLPIPGTLAYLLTIYRWSQSPDKDRQLQENLEKVLSGVYKGPQIRILAKRARAEKDGIIIRGREEAKRGESITITPLDKTKGDPRSLEAFESGMRAFNFLIDTVLERNSFIHLRSLFGKQCLDLSTRLNCIGDKEFHELWRQRKEVKL